MPERTALCLDRALIITGKVLWKASDADSSPPTAFVGEGEEEEGVCWALIPSWVSNCPNRSIITLHPVCVSSSGTWLNKGGGSSERWQGPPEQSASFPLKAVEGARGIQDGTTGPQNARLSLIHGLRSLVSSEGNSHSVETQWGHPDTESKGLGSKGTLVHPIAETPAPSGDPTRKNGPWMKTPPS